MGLTTLPADALPTLDWNAIVVLIGTGVGTAVAVAWNYKQKRSDPVVPAKDVVLPTTAIADMRWGPEMLVKLSEIQLCLTGWREDMAEWREQELHKRELREAYEKGRQARERGGLNRSSPND